MARWHLDLEIDPASSVPLTLQIIRTISSEVRRGRLRPGALLPGSRTLARSLGVSRNTVFAAYEELEAEGWLQSSPTRGTFVSEDLPDSSPRGRPAEPRSKRADRIGFDLESIDLAPLDATVGRGALRWDFGLPDTRLAPVDALARAYSRVLRKHGRTVLQYDRYAEVDSPLESVYAAMLSSTRGLAVDASQVVLTRGSQMGLYLVVRALVRPGDVVAVEHPGYVRMWELLRAAGARVVPIAVDRHGIDVGALEEVSRSQAIRAVALTPHHQFPTTVTMSIARRLELLELARKKRFAIIEDDFDHEFRYEGHPVLPIAAADDSGIVVYVSSLSKILAPGLRCGHVVAPAPLSKQLRQLRKLIDIQGDQALDWALAELFEDGEVQRHVNRARRIYRARRDRLAEALERRLGGIVRFNLPSGGLALWVSIDPAIDVELWAERARAVGLLFRTGRIFYFDDPPAPMMRLGFARLNEKEQDVALSRLASTVPAAKERRPRFRAARSKGGLEHSI
jgi:GntR family transcriptional regulator / MocR family aminotransferase